MSTHTPNERRTERLNDPRTTDAPDTASLAAELGVDARLLADFVEWHTSPTPAIVIGWAHGRGELRCHPEQLRPDVEAWLEARTRTGAGHGLTEEELRKSSVQAHAIRSILGGDVE